MTTDGRKIDLTLKVDGFTSRQIPWNLLPLSYRGAAAVNAISANTYIDAGRFGTPVADRIALLRAIHEVLEGLCAGGQSIRSLRFAFYAIRMFYKWADGADRLVVMETVEADFVAYSDWLWHRSRVERTLGADSAYAYATGVSCLIDRALDRTIPLITRTRLRKVRAQQRVLGTQDAKQNLAEIRTFCHGLVDICESLTIDALCSRLPIRIAFRGALIRDEWCGAIRSQHTHGRKSGLSKLLDACRIDNIVDLRRQLVRMRIDAEMLIFISQTGMNLEQAQQLPISRFGYQSHIDGYKVRSYKGRRSGSVEFEVYKEYRAYFERYLAWRNALFYGDESDLLFPIMSKRSSLFVSDFRQIERRFREVGIPFFRPRKIRRVRVNWLLRRSGNPELTAEQAQHSVQELLGTYAEPNHQLAVSEISKFHASNDPALKMPGVGVCIGATPTPQDGTPTSAPVPDCISPAGCLFCKYQRDIDSLDYVWSLFSYRHLKSLELTRQKISHSPASSHPAELVLERVTLKLKSFSGSSKTREAWVQECSVRMDEDCHHPNWDGLIRLMELHQ